MSSGLLPDHIGPLVDRLRAGDHLPIALPDVAAVTEVLMRSLESYFKSIDLTLYKECQDLADYIEDARSEISSLSPDHDDSAGIPRAGKELDAIVEATEGATDTIMQAAEDLMSFDTDNFDEYKEHVNSEVLKIFEACSFQDITGQRISKVVKTLNHVEDRVGKLIAILGITSSSAAAKGTTSILDTEDGEISDEDLLNGPALAGEGIDQGEIDDLLEGGFDAPGVASAAEMEEAAEAEEAPQEQQAEQPDDDAAVEEEEAEAETEEVEAEAEEAAEVEVEVEEVAEEAAEAEVEAEAEEVEVEAEEVTKVEDAAVAEGDKKETSQQDIDSLFG